MQLFEESIHFLGRVLMHQAHADHAALFFHIQPLRNGESVVIAVPDKDPAIAQGLRDPARIERRRQRQERQPHGPFLKSSPRH